MVIGSKLFCNLDNLKSVKMFEKAYIYRGYRHGHLPTLFACVCVRDIVPG